MQRSMQWGDDALARCFGVDCQTPTLYAYFACSIRNRLEVKASDNFRSPLEGVPPGSPWRAEPGFSVKRPTKLIDGSRGGQAFIAEILAPELNKHYSISDQSRMQLLSVLLVGAGLTREDGLDEYIEVVLPKDFDLAPGLGVNFTRLLIGLLAFSFVCVALLVSTWWSLLRHNLYGGKGSLAWITKVLSLACWGVGAMGLLMMGGNPRVTLVQKKVAKIILDRIAELVETPEDSSTAENPTTIVESCENEIIETEISLLSPGREEDRTGLEIKGSQPEKTEITVIESNVDSKLFVAELLRMPSETSAIRRRDQTPIKIQLGSLHGSVFTPDRGFCVLPVGIVERICALDIKPVRSRDWVAGVAWFGLILLAGITLQIGGILAPSFAADLASLVFLLLTSLARGAGVSGPEKWMIPKWMRRPNTVNGAVLMGQYRSRTGTEV